MQASEVTRRPRLVVTLLTGLVAVVLVGLGIWLVAGGGAQARREAEVSARGAAVMPFDLERTSHIFEPLPDGGVQQVSDDPSDAAQIGLIRLHLQEEAAKFQRGDFGDPAAIHGDGMPGLAELRDGFAQISVAYAKLPNGAEIRYTTGDPAMVAAVHAWFQAQLSDHGGHAMEHGAP
jgi:hypothetical protein